MKLRNGSEEAEPLVRSVRMAMFRLFDEKPIAFHELVELAKDENHRPFGKTPDCLLGFDLIDGDGKMHSSTRNIVLSSIDGDGLELRIVSCLE